VPPCAGFARNESCDGGVGPVELAIHSDGLKYADVVVPDVSIGVIAFGERDATSAEHVAKCLEM
jgi:hypothetical protein